MNKKFKLIFILSFLLNCFVYSQTTIKGKINFDNDEKNNSVTIILKNNNKTIDYSISNSDDTYKLNTDEYGIFELVFSSLNFETKYVSIEISKEVKEIEKNVLLTYKPIELNEVIIEPEKQIKIKNDTIVFKAKSFLQGNEQVVEDLLKKIPGINVSADGSISIGNQEIEKIMVDGDDFFDKGYRILTKNMPVNPIDNIELYQNYSNNKHLKGIENSHKVALNITLKEDYKRIWFGNALLGYGLISKDQYNVKSNLMNFGKKTKHYFITNLNNTGDDALGYINHLIRPFRVDEPSSLGDDQVSKKIINFSFEQPKLKSRLTNLNNTELITLNSIFSLSKNIKLKTLVLFNSDENDFIRNSIYSFFFNSTSFTNIENFIGRKKQNIGFGKLEFIYDISKNQMFEYIGKFNTSKEKNNRELIFNNNPIYEKLITTNQLLDHKIIYTNKFKENKVFIFTGRSINEKSPQNYSVNQFLFNDLFNQDANQTKQYSDDIISFYGIEAHLLNKKENEDLFEIKVGNQFRKDKLISHLELINDDNNSISFPVNYQNNLKYSTNDLYFTAKYIFKLNRYKFLLQSDFHQLINRFENFNNTTSQKPSFIIPKIGLDFVINSKNKIYSSYIYNTTNTGILDIYPAYIQTDYRNLSKGLEEFNQINLSNLIINYTFGDWGDKFFANSIILYTKNNDFYSNNSTISQNYTLTEKTIIQDRNLLSFSSNFDYFLLALKSNLKINLSVNKSNYKNIVNNSNLREINSISSEYGLELRSGFKGIFNYHFGTKWYNNQVKTTTINKYRDNTTFLDINIFLNSKFNFQIQSERYYFGNLDKAFNKYYFLDLQAKYTIKENKLTFFLSGNNLLNTKTFNNYSISDVNVAQTEYRLQPRFILLKVEFKF